MFPEGRFTPAFLYLYLFLPGHRPMPSGTYQRYITKIYIFGKFVLWVS